ncbi:MAG: metallophosphoesterase family protein [Planctomycetota bacterium]
MKAVISDIHSNLEALAAVLGDIRAKGITDIACLGDVIGYGPNPKECLDLLRDAKVRFILMGNHEEALLSGGEDFNVKARLAVAWTRKQLEEKFAAEPGGVTVWNWVKALPPLVREKDILYVHASPRDPTKDYVFPRDVYDGAKMRDIFSRIDRICFCGHTHQPGVITETGKFLSPKDFINVFFLEKEKVLVNVGSVGQPRDGDNRAGYVTLDDDTIVFRRVPYEYTRTIEKVYAEDALDKFLGDRLEEGR